MELSDGLVELSDGIEAVRLQLSPCRPLGGGWWPGRHIGDHPASAVNDRIPPSAAAAHSTSTTATG